MSRKFIIGLTVFCLSPTVMAADCNHTIKSPREALVCILENHPNLKALRIRGSELSAREDVAKQFPNPELDATSKLAGEKKVEIDLLQPIELGGKREARLQIARAENLTLKLQDEEKHFAVLLEAIQQIARYRQLRSELAIANESIASVRNIISRLRRRPNLPPDKANSLRLFTLLLNTL